MAKDKDVAPEVEVVVEEVPDNTADNGGLPDPAPDPETDPVAAAAKAAALADELAGARVIVAKADKDEYEAEVYAATVAHAREVVAAADGV